MAAWAEAGHDPSREATQFAAGDAARAARVAARADVGRRLSAAGAPSRGPEGTAPPATRCQRVDRFLDELFACVLDPAVPADNTRAARGLRPLVIARTVSGARRSAAGSRVRMARASLVATWLAQGHNPLDACHQTLLAPTD